MSDSKITFEQVKQEAIDAKNLALNSGQEVYKKQEDHLISLNDLYKAKCAQYTATMAAIAKSNRLQNAVIQTLQARLKQLETQLKTEQSDEKSITSAELLNEV